MAKIVKIFHYNAKLTKLRDILLHEGIPRKGEGDAGFGVTEKEFLNFSDENQTTNREKLFNTFADNYKYDEKITSAEDIDVDSPIYSPIIFALPSQYASKFILTSESTLQIANDDYTAFLSAEIVKIINSPTYKDEFVTRSNPRISVFVWSKALNGQTAFKENSIINITPFVQDLQINNAKNGGNFSISVMPVLATLSYDIDGKPVSWGFEDANLHTFVDKVSGETQMVSKVNINSKAPLVAKTFFSQSLGEDKEPVEPDEDGEVVGEKIVRSQFLFTNILAENDVVFIKFENIDNNEPTGDLSDYYIPSSKLAGQNWDMIGLIDKNTTQMNGPSYDVNSQIGGRDLIKLLIEDGTYFYANHYSNPDNDDSIFKHKYVDARGDRSSAVNNSILPSEKMNRIMGYDAEPIINGIFSPSARTIEYVMNLLIRALSNVEICPTGLFSSIEDKTVYQYEIENDDRSGGNTATQASKNEEKQVE